MTINFDTVKNSVLLLCMIAITIMTSLMSLTLWRDMPPATSDQPPVIMILTPSYQIKEFDSPFKAPCKYHSEITEIEA